LLPVPDRVDWDGNGTADENDEWIELYNAGSETIELEGWVLATAQDPRPVRRLRPDLSKVNLVPYRFPAGTALQTEEYLVVYHRSSDLEFEDDGGGLWLFDDQRRLVDRLVYGRVPADASLIRLSDWRWTISQEPNPGGPDAPGRGP